MTGKQRAYQPTMAIGTALLLVGLWSSCYYPRSKPGWEYMPDMAHGTAYETYSINPFFADSMASRPAVPRSIPRGPYQPFHFSKTPQGYDSAGKHWFMPVGMDEEDLKAGQHHYVIYCAVCHGPEGKANGSIVENPNVVNPYPPPPSYFREDILNLPEGKMYYSIYYGKNLMGAYGKVLNPEEIWQVVYYVKSLQKKYLDSVQAAAASSAAASTPKP
ncbi:MAG: cytochrome c [Chitinophagales bacterium]|nr:cytochrome c [Chitinophagales bacterium]MDW8428589.1 cytochrome c [Chitinophagales bacterium]